MCKKHYSKVISVSPLSLIKLLLLCHSGKAVLDLSAGTFTSCTKCQSEKDGLYHCPW